MPARKSKHLRRREIEQTALGLAFGHGPDQVTTGMIAGELGLTQPAIYKHFPCKGDIWSAVAQRLSLQISHNIADAARQSQDPEARLKTLVLGQLHIIRHNPALPLFMTGTNTQGDQAVVRDSVQAAMGSFRAALENCVRDAIAKGTFRATMDAMDAAMLVMGVIQSLVLRMLVTRDPEILTQHGERLLDLLLTGFTQTKGDT